LASAFETVFFLLAAPHGLHGLAEAEQGFLTAHGLQGFFLAAQGFFAAQGLQGVTLLFF